MKEIHGGVCAPKGFQASGVHCGIRKNKNKKDLALIVSDVMCHSTSVYTLNKVKGAPIFVTKNHLNNHEAKAIICNSGNANTCNSNGLEIANEVCELCAKELNIDASDIIIASTGVIGEPLNIEPFSKHMKNLVEQLNVHGSDDAAHAIMTTDTSKKECAVEFMLHNQTCHIGAIAKGSGMIHPNMATMLSFITTDVNISKDLLDQVLHEVVNDTFNMVSVDGDTSTNDMVSILANGLAKNPMIIDTGSDYQIFKEALLSVCIHLAREIASDGEGATKLITCHVMNAKTIKDAKIISKSVITSSLVKAAMFGKDANWGRTFCAIGYSEAEYNVNLIDVHIKSQAGEICVCKQGMGIVFSEEKALDILQEDEIIIDIDLHMGSQNAKAWGCDLTYDYVKINGDYRT